MSMATRCFSNGRREQFLLSFARRWQHSSPCEEDARCAGTIDFLHERETTVGKGARLFRLAGAGGSTLERDERAVRQGDVGARGLEGDLEGFFTAAVSAGRWRDDPARGI